MCGVRKHVHDTNLVQTKTLVPDQQARIARERCWITGDINHAFRAGEGHAFDNICCTGARRIKKHLVIITIDKVRGHIHTGKVDNMK